MKKIKTVVVLPAYNAEKTLVKTISQIPKRYVDEIILVDDASTDKTVAVAKKTSFKNFKIYRHKKNLGYGANQKTCYRLALKDKADIIIMLHPDYQYDPKLVKYFVGLMKDGYFDVMLGSRIRSREETIKSGMPVYKYLSNRILTLIENFLSGQNLSEWHTGMRAFKREVLESISFEKNSDDFVFDSQILFQVIEKGFKIGEISVPVRYLSDSSSINFWRGLKYGIETLLVGLNFFIKKRILRQ
ncbi:MAG: glycosyltransferase family 2 protein [Patescibacteria group bacterium]|nr:glycosyltransferase family 2 protein [Patescibacteria group bacterium]